MATTSQAPSWLAPLTDYAPLAVFFATYVLYDLMTATGALVVATLLALALGYAAARRVPLIALLTASLVCIFGGLTLLFSDDTFIKMKPTIVQLLFAAALGVGLAIGRSPLRAMLGHAIDINAAGWRKLSWRFAGFFVAMAGLNEIVWRTQSEAFWVNFKVFGLLALTLLFTLAQMRLIQRHRGSETEAGSTGRGAPPR